MLKQLKIINWLDTKFLVWNGLILLFSYTGLWIRLFYGLYSLDLLRRCACTSSCFPLNKIYMKSFWNKNVWWQWTKTIMVKWKKFSRVFYRYLYGIYFVRCWWALVDLKMVYSSSFCLSWIYIHTIFPHLYIKKKELLITSNKIFNRAKQQVYFWIRKHYFIHQSQ